MSDTPPSHTPRPKLPALSPDDFLRIDALLESPLLATDGFSQALELLCKARCEYA